jgi:large subunit ribosomal protein L12
MIIIKIQKSLKTLLKENKKMEYIYAAMLLHKAGKEINEDAMEKTLTAAGVSADKARIKATITALKDVDIDKVISEASVAAPAASAAPSASAEGEAKKEEKSPEEEKKSEEEAAAGLGALFG